MQSEAGASELSFLSGGGEMGALIRAHDWCATPLGHPAHWPQPLRTVLRLMLNTGHPMYIFWGTAGYCFYNDAYRQSIGPERHPGSLGLPAHEVWAEIWDIIGPQFEQVIAGRGATWHENQLVPITRNGRVDDVYWTYSYSPIDDDSAQHGVGGVLVVCTETTGQVLAQQRIADNARRQLQMFEQAPSFMAVLKGPEHVYDFVNAAYVRIVTKPDIIGKTVRAALPELEGQGIFELLDRVYATGERFVAREIEVLLQDNAEPALRRYFLDFVYEPMLDEAGLVSGIFVEGYDVTERKLAEIELRASEARLRDLNADLERQVIERAREQGRTWQVSPDLLSVITLEGRFEIVNPAWHAALGWAEHELVGAPYVDFVHPDDLAPSAAAFEKIKRGEPVFRFENRYRSKPGGYRWLSWVAVPEGGKLYSSARDITEEKSREQNLQILEAHLRQAQKMEAVGQLTGGIAHDFNNMLTGVLGGLDMARRRLADGRTHEADRFLETVRQSGERAAGLTQRLLTFSRRQSLDIKSVDANALTRGIEDLLRRTLGENIEVRLVLAADLWPVEADINQLESALLNLAINARDAMPRDAKPIGGCLVIETQNLTLNDLEQSRRYDLEPGNYVMITVSDNGVGMSKAVMERAFDPFFTTKPIGQGTGLGLSMIYGFAKQSRGHAAITSEVGQGTSVQLILRKADVAVQAPEGVDSATARPPRPSETILVIEDEAAVRMLITEVLHDLGYQYLEAGDADAALPILRSDRHLDLLISDVGLPGMDGRQLADLARQLKPGLKILFVSGYSEQAMRGGFLAEGMQMITKPFTVDAFADKVRQVLSRD